MEARTTPPPACNAGPGAAYRGRRARFRFGNVELDMKQGIHPDYKPATVICACGNRFETMSTQEEVHVEICSVCHPFYTGKQRLVDTAGRVDRFKKKYEKVGK
jgi:large subunit ribosomal protein L31